MNKYTKYAEFCAFMREILHIITSKHIDLSLKGLTAPLLKFLKSLQGFIYKACSVSLKF